MEVVDRKKEVLNACLDFFIEKGLSKTSTRDLGSAMKLQSSGMFYYFSSEDELIIACAEEATLRIEKILIATAIKEVRTPATLMETLQKKQLKWLQL